MELFWGTAKLGEKNTYSSIWGKRITRGTELYREGGIEIKV